MAHSLDPHVAKVLDRTNADSDDEDALIASLEEEDDTQLDALREKRLQQLHGEVTRMKMMRNSEHGTYMEVKEEKAVMDITTSTKLCVVHFFKPDFHRCGVMDNHLEPLAAKHFDTRFIKINVDNAPFLVTKLNIKVLPCVLAFVDGISADRIIGFEGLSENPEKFSTRDLEVRLLSAGVLVRAKLTEGNGNVNIRSGKKQRDEYDEDQDDEYE